MRVQPQAGQGAFEIGDAPGVVVERDHFDVPRAKFEQVRRLPPRRRAGVEHPAPARRVEESRGKLGRFVLDRHQPFAEVRNGLDGPRRIEGDPLGGVSGRPGPEPGARQDVEVAPS